MSSHRSADPLATLPPLGARPRPAVRALAGVAVVVAALGAGVLAWRARPAGRAGRRRRRSPIAVQHRMLRRCSWSRSPAGSSDPGLVRLPAGARVADAIEAAGGALPGTDLSALNLARKVTDGELIVVGLPPPPGGVRRGRRLRGWST